MAEFNHSYIGHLVLLAQDGNSDAFAELYAITYQHTYNYAVHYLRNRDLAQDAVQETYISALRNIGGIKEPSLFVAWLNQICFRVCYDMTKSKNSSYGELTPELIELLCDEKPANNPEASAAASDEIDRLKEAINSLPFLEKQVIVMRYYNDMKLEEIASALRVSRSSVKRYLNSSKERLAQIMGKGEL